MIPARKSRAPQMLDTEASRFRARASKSGFENAQLLRGDAPEHLDNGWLPPTPSLPTGAPCDGIPIATISAFVSERYKPTSLGRATI